MRMPGGIMGIEGSVVTGLQEVAGLQEREHPLPLRGSFSFFLFFSFPTIHFPTIRHMPSGSLPQ